MNLFSKSKSVISKTTQGRSCQLNMSKRFFTAFIPIILKRKNFKEALFLFPASLLSFCSTFFAVAPGLQPVRLVPPTSKKKTLEFQKSFFFGMKSLPAGSGTQWGALAPAIQSLPAGSGTQWGALAPAMKSLPAGSGTQWGALAPAMKSLPSGSRMKSKKFFFDSLPHHSILRTKYRDTSLIGSYLFLLFQLHTYFEMQY